MASNKQLTVVKGVRGDRKEDKDKNKTWFITFIALFSITIGSICILFFYIYYKRGNNIPPNIGPYISIFVLMVLCIAVTLSMYYIHVYLDDKTSTSPLYREEKKYKEQNNIISNKISKIGNRKDIFDLLSKNNRNFLKYFEEMPPLQQCFVNFYSLGCRYSYYMGPMNEGYFDPDNAIKYTVQSGCRTFILDIDYLDECIGDTITYYPRLVVRDINNRLRIKYNSNLPICNSPQHSNIKYVCDKINIHAFSSATCNNSSDPVIIVLYFLRCPPGSNFSKTVLDYYSNVAKAIRPFQDRLLTNEINGGTYYRQKQESRLLTNNIKDYKNKVLIFSNADTSGFTDDKAPSYSTQDDLDYLVNLRLQYDNVKDKSSYTLSTIRSKSRFGSLKTAASYTIVPIENRDAMIDEGKLNWTICLSDDPSIPVKDSVYNTTNEFGVNCVPIVLFDENNDFMFSDKLFKSYSYIPKPELLRYKKSPDYVPYKLSKKYDCDGGNLTQLGLEDQEKERREKEIEKMEIAEIIENRAVEKKLKQKMESANKEKVDNIKSR